jgi:hypothetical protein
MHIRVHSLPLLSLTLTYVYIFIVCFLSYVIVLQSGRQVSMFWRNIVYAYPEGGRSMFLQNIDGLLLHCSVVS